MSGATLGPVQQLGVGFWAPLEAQSLLPWMMARTGMDRQDGTGKGKIFFTPDFAKGSPIKLA